MVQRNIALMLPQVLLTPLVLCETDTSYVSALPTGTTRYW